MPLRLFNRSNAYQNLDNEGRAPDPRSPLDGKGLVPLYLFKNKDATKPIAQPHLVNAQAAIEYLKSKTNLYPRVNFSEIQKSPITQDQDLPEIVRFRVVEHLTQSLCKIVMYLSNSDRFSCSRPKVSLDKMLFGDDDSTGPTIFAVMKKPSVALSTLTGKSDRYYKMAENLAHGEMALEDVGRCLEWALTIMNVVFTYYYPDWELKDRRVTGVQFDERNMASLFWEKLMPVQRATLSWAYFTACDIRNHCKTVHRTESTDKNNQWVQSTIQLKDDSTDTVIRKQSTAYWMWMREEVKTLRLANSKDSELHINMDEGLDQMAKAATAREQPKWATAGALAATPIENNE